MKRFLPLLAAFAAFQVFNYAATDYALTDLLGGLAVAGVRWATILTAAFCAIDLVGPARLLSVGDNPDVDLYLFGAWVLAAAMNATLTWWSVSLAMGQRAGNIFPVAIAVVVWVARILIVGALWAGGSSQYDPALSRRRVPRRAL